MTVKMSEMAAPALNPEKNCEGWETIEGDSQVSEAVANSQQKQAEPAASESKWGDKVHVEEHQQYEIVIESPGMKQELQKVVYEVDGDADDEPTENYNKETAAELARLARKKMEQEQMAAAGSD